MLRVIDTHCHFVQDSIAQLEALSQARAAGLIDAVVLATQASEAKRVQALACDFGLHYGLGLHPLLIADAQAIDSEITVFERTLKEALADPRLVAVGEIGLDAFPGACRLDLSEQIRLFEVMLSHAKAAKLPTSIHSRKALSCVLSCIKKIPVTGVLHAFSGSFEEATQSLKLGLKLGFGPSLTYPGSKRIRDVFARLPEDAFVLETDAPYMLTAARRAAGETICRPCDIFEVLEAAAWIRGVSPEVVAEVSTRNARAVFPRLGTGSSLAS